MVTPFLHGKHVFVVTAVFNGQILLRSSHDYHNTHVNHIGSAPLYCPHISAAVVPEIKVIRSLPGRNAVLPDPDILFIQQTEC
jgi:hypothetical protein